MSFATVTYTVTDRVARLTFNRPEAMNAFNPQMIADTRAAFADAIDTDAVRVIVMTGSGRAFSAGADLASGTGAPDGLSPGEGVAWSLDNAFNPMAREIMGCPKPVIAAVNGVAAGGGVGVALAADIVVAARSATFIQVFTRQLGLIPDVGCTWMLPRLIGHARTRALTMLGDRLNAETAERWGLIWKCVPDDALETTIEEIAGRLTKGAPHALAALKDVLDESWQATFEEQLDLERDVQGRLGDTPDFIEGVTAFLQKRPPHFTGD